MEYQNPIIKPPINEPVIQPIQYVLEQPIVQQEPIIDPVEDIITAVDAKIISDEQGITSLEEDFEEEEYKDFEEEKKIDLFAQVSIQLSGLDNIFIVKKNGKLIIKQLSHKAFLKRICSWIKHLFVNKK